MMGIPIADPTDTDEHIIDGRAWYTHGVGLGSTFLEYVPTVISPLSVYHGECCVFYFEAVAKMM
jgi:hypothetical protein